MIRAGKIVVSSAAFVVLFGAGLAPDAPLRFGMLPEAQAVVGAPLTPASAAGVARRTTRRTVAVTSTATAAAATPQTVVVQTAPAPATSGALPIGTVVAALPAGCSTMTMSGVEYYKCGPDYYRAAYQGTNLVYVTAQP
jgi:hypothetical protein